MRILYIAHRIPYPPNKGDKIRSFNEIKYLSSKHEIHLACLADNPRDLTYQQDLKQYCQSVTVVPISRCRARLKSLLFLPSDKALSIPYFYSSALQNAIDRLLSTIGFDCIFCFSSPTAEYVFKSNLVDRRQSIVRSTRDKGTQLSAIDDGPSTMNHRLSTTKLIMDFVDVDSDKWAQYARYASFPKSWIYRLESSRLSRYERKVGEAFNHSLFVTQAEVEVFRNANPHIRNVTAISNGVDVDYFSPAYSSPASGSRHPASSGDRRPKIVFTGAMDYHANVDSVCWFSNEIFPRIRQELPETEFYIVGSNPTSEVKALSNNNGIIVTGFVPDMREYLKRATVAVAPLRIARGIQNKVLEAMAMGLPVVATPQAFEGIDAAPADDLLVEDGAEAFSKALTQVLRTPSLRTYLGINARKCIESNYSWSKHFSKLDELIE